MHHRKSFARSKPQGSLSTGQIRKRLGERRIAIVSTMAFIGHGDLDDTFGITALLLADKHDLIHKAAGWMLREAGKKSERALLAFLKRNYARIPRTMLRYAIERFPIERRRKILQGVF